MCIPVPMSSRSDDASSDTGLVTVDGRAYRIEYVPAGATWTYDIRTLEGEVLARLARASDTSGLPWTVRERRPSFDPRTANAVLTAAVDRKLVTGHTGRLSGTLVAVAGGYATIALVTGAQLSLPCQNRTAELVYQEALKRGADAVVVDLIDGVPMGFEMVAPLEVPMAQCGTDS